MQRLDRANEGGVGARSATRRRRRYRDQVRALSRVQARQYVESNRGVDADVVACVIEGGIACVNLVMIRGGRHVGDRSFFPANAEGAAAAEVLQRVPRAALPRAAGRRRSSSVRNDVEFCDLKASHGRYARPHGERRVWLDMARKNAELAHRAAGARPRHPGGAAASRCARRSGCPRARSASSASTSATRWARRRSPPAWSTIASSMQKIGVPALQHPRHHARRRLRRDAPGAGAPLRAGDGARRARSPTWC